MMMLPPSPPRPRNVFDFIPAALEVAALVYPECSPVDRAAHVLHAISARGDVTGLRKSRRASAAIAAPLMPSFRFVGRERGRDRAEREAFRTALLAMSSAQRVALARAVTAYPEVLGQLRRGQRAILATVALLYVDEPHVVEALFARGASDYIDATIAALDVESRVMLQETTTLGVSVDSARQGGLYGVARIRKRALFELAMAWGFSAAVVQVAA
jgi:hypothetical protein